MISTTSTPYWWAIRLATGCVIGTHKSHTGVGVKVGVGVADGVYVGDGVKVAVLVGVSVAVAVLVGVSAAVAVLVGV